VKNRKFHIERGGKGMERLNMLRVNLTEGTVKQEPLNEEWVKQYIGGRGYGTKLLYEELEPGTDPLSEGNKLIFANGPLTGSNVPTGGRYMVVTKSPLTGFIASSNSGGYWGAELARAGYMVLVFEGKAKNPSTSGSRTTRPSCATLLRSGGRTHT
jgi:aldehyde:ferredoxin oxidoreductase